MISSIIFTGVAIDMIDKKFRYIETRNGDPFHPEQDYVSKIPVLYWTRDEFNALTRVKNGTFIIVKGHLESNNEIGLYVLAESIHVAKEGEVF